VSTGRRVLEVSALLWWAISAVVLAWQVAALVRGTTFGPGGPPLIAPLSDAFQTCAVVLCAIPAIAILVRWLRRVGRPAERSLLLQISAGVAVLALSYRLAGLVLVILAIGYGWIHHGRWQVGGWSLWVVAFLASVAPIDVTLRNSPYHGPQLVVAMNCDAATDGMVRAVYRGELVCVANGAVLYYPPNKVLVW
jgi:hypothetical protein